MDGIERQLQYEIFLAEESMRMSLKRLSDQAKYVTEAADMIILNESVVEVIKKYLKTVTASIQKAWNSFKKKIDMKIIHLVIDNNEKLLTSDFKMKLPDDYEYPEINVWNDINQNCTIENNILTTANYKQMTQYLETPEDFLKQFYPNFIEQDNGKQMRLVDVFEKRCFTRASDQSVVDANLINEYKEFLLDYENQINGIQADIDSINKVNQNIDQMLRELGLSESTVFIGNLLLEAGGNQQQQNTNPTNNNENNNKFRNADPNAANQTGNNTKDRQYIVNYYKAMTQILTAKMRTCNKVKSNALRIVTNFVRLQGGITKLPQKNANTTTTVQRTTNTAPQVK